MATNSPEINQKVQKEGLGKKPRISIIGKIGIPLSVIAALLISIASLTAYEFFQFRLSITNLSTSTLPQITLNSRLSSLINQLLYQTERLVGSDSQPERRLAWGDIQQQFIKILRFSQDIEYSSPIYSPAHQIDMLKTTLSDLNALIDQRLEIENKVQVSIQEILEIERELVITGTFIRAIASESESNIIEEWFQNALYMTDIALKMTTHTSLYQAKALEKQADRLLKRHLELNQLLPQVVRVLTQQLNDELHEHVYGSAGLIPLTMEHLRVSSKTIGRSNFARSLVGEVGEAGISLFIEMNDTAHLEVITLSERINRKAKLLALLALGALLITVIVFVYFRHALIGRLITLNNEILDKVAGNDCPVTQNGNDEISDIAHSVNYFTTELSTAKEKAEAASDAKSSFLAHMSHEIRTPLNAITGFCGIALKKPVDSEIHDCLEKIEDSSHVLLGVINDILDFSKIEAGELNFETIEFDLREQLDKLSNMITLKCGEKNLDFIIDIRAGTPQILTGDPLRLNQILTNLLNNSVKFTSSGHVLLEVRYLEARTGDDRPFLEFHISDTGIGMTEEQINNLFVPFKQADNSITRRYGGTGLGMTITKLLIDRIDGSIEVASSIGKGTTVHVQVPFLAVDGTQEAKLPSALQNLNALLVDACTVRNEVVNRIINDFGLRTTSVSSISKAEYTIIADEEKDSHDIILVDRNLSGVEERLTETILASCPEERQPALIRMSYPNSFEPFSKHTHLPRTTDVDYPITARKLIKAFSELFPEHFENANMDNKLALPTAPQDYQLQGRHILLVEDNYINQQVARQVLENEGINVTIANHGLEALEILAENNPLRIDLLLMDIQMPELDGYSTTKRIREIRGDVSRLPIVAMTAQAMKEDYEKCIAAGMDGYVSKPIEFESFFATIDQFLNRPKE